MMYENTFSTDKLTVVRWAKENAAAWIKWQNEQLAECRERLLKAEADLIDWCDHRRRLDQDYPDVLIQEKTDDVENSQVIR